ncbi:hypothetical protein [Alteraurantiacibacter palmitatis]|uniref:5-bromo-4-chloroindolyl phosphate hydrolase n=1 Tax=Alteraurantiacibacter palmitatis TaxID=2054628 RepID=A0ABV7E2R1_9SPHN
MADDLTRQSERLLADAQDLLRDNRAGGRYRLSGPAIGEGSRRLRKSNLATRLKLIAASLAAIIVASGVVGLIVDGIGFVGVMVTVLAMAAAVLIFGNFPKVKVPTRAELARTQDARALVARTELWLEGQRAALPAPASRLVENIGTRLDALGAQLAHVDPGHPAAAETRKLVGEILPETIEAYRRIPAHLRGEARAGSTPDGQLVDSLTKIAHEIDQVTRQLAEGSLDELAVRTRYLDYRYGTGSDAGVPLPDLQPADTQFAERK